MNNKSDFISIGKRHVRVILDSRGGVQRLCLNDLCAILGREFVRPNQDASRLCPKSVKLPFKANGHRMWSVTLADIPLVTETVRREKPELERRCLELERWAKELTAPKHPDPLPETSAESSPNDTPVTFTYQDRIPVSFRWRSGRVMVNATQLTKGFQRQPIEWLRLKDTVRLRKEMAEEEVTAPLDEQIFTVRGRNNGATWMEAPLALELARWLSPELAPWCQECIGKLNPVAELSCEPVSDAVPEETVEAVVGNIGGFTVPKTYSEALQLAAELQAQIEQNGPKMEVYEDLVESRDSFSTTRLADELRVTAQQLNRFLEDHGVCRRDSKQWIACGEYRKYQTEVPYLFHSKRGHIYKCGTALRWKPEGREFIIRLWRTHNPSSHE